MKVICEIYRDDTNELGEVGRRAKHSLDFVDAVQYLNLPDEFLNLADEYMVSVNLICIWHKILKGFRIMPPMNMNVCKFLYANGLIIIREYLRNEWYRALEKILRNSYKLFPYWYLNHFMVVRAQVKQLFSVCDIMASPYL